MTQNTTHKIGVLIPQSNAYPLIGKEFIAGLRIGLGEESYQLSIESIAFGADPKQIINATQKLIFQEENSLITGLMGHHGFVELTEFMSKNEEVLLAANLGATAPVNLPQGTFLNSLDLYNALQDLVLHFSKNNIAKIETSTCYYESGYGFIHALAKSIEQTDNVEFAGHFITPHSPRENEAQLMEQHITEDNPDAIVAFHNGIFAKEHATFLNESEIYKKYPIYALPFTCEDNLINDFKPVFQNVKSVSSWYPELENEANNNFILKYSNAKGKPPSFFSLLGYENGLIIANAIKNGETPIKKAIEQTTIEGPRGEISFNPDSNCTRFNNHIWEITGDKKTTIAKLEANNLNTVNQNLESEASGWFNAYLCH